MKKTLRNIFTVGGFTVLSRVFGLGREMLQSRLIGAGVEQSAFTLAFALPNMARKLFGEGALTAAFVPVFKESVDQGEIEEARRLARTVMTLVLLLLSACVVLVVAGLTLFMTLGNDLSPRTALTLRLVRILFPYMVFICGAAFSMGTLNALGRFAEGAFMPALLNVIWITTLGVLCFFPSLSIATRITVVSWAILAGGAVQMLFLFRCLRRRGFGPKFSFAGWRSERTRMVWHNTFIAAIGAGAVHLNSALDQYLAQYAAPWAAGVIGYAERLMDLPLGVIGVAFGTVLLPTFAGFFALGDMEGARKSFAQSVVQLFAVMLPAAVGMFIVAGDLTAVIYEGRAFDAAATLRVSRALSVYALGLVFFGLQKALIPWFQAQKDMKTPLRVSLCTVILNAMLNVVAVLFLPQKWRHVGLAASTDLCAVVGCVLLAVLAVRRNGGLGLTAILPTLSRMLIAALAMGTVLFGVRHFLSGTPRLLLLAVEVIAGGVVYLAAMAALGQAHLLRRVLRR